MTSHYITLAVFAAFLAAGCLVYALYGRRHSRLATGAVTPDATAVERQAV